MDPITATAITVATAAVMKRQAQKFFEDVLGEPAKSLGSLLAEKINARRHKNLIKIAVKANERLRDAGVTPNEVPLKIINPMLEAASLEEEPDLQEMWANLFANAANPRQQEPVAPSFIIILKELTTRDVKFLDALFDATVNAAETDPSNTGVLSKTFDNGTLKDIYANAGLSRLAGLGHISHAEAQAHRDDFRADITEFTLRVDTLKRHGVIVEAFQQRDAFPRNRGRTVLVPIYRLSELGRRLVVVCKPPSK